MALASPKEKRRSTRRSAHSSSKSSGSSGSPTPDAPPASAGPALSDAARSAASSSNGSASRAKRSKDDADDYRVPLPPSSSHKRTNSHASTINGALSAPTPSSSKRTKRKGKEAAPVDDTPDATSLDAVESKNPEPDDPADDAEKAEEDGGITRCVCNGLALDDDGDAPDFMIQCEQCLAWQHGPCMGFAQESEIPEGNYYCEQCKPEDHVELLKKLARRQRQGSEKSALASQRSRTSRSHSPTHFMKPPKRRNTMNSRDAAYEEQLKELLDATAAEATPNNDVSNKDLVDTVANTEEPYEEINETGTGGRKKRKRADDDTMPTKRKRSASLISDGLAVTGTGLEKPEVSTPITTALLPPPLPTGKSRARRGGRKNAPAQEPSVNGEGEEVGTPTTKKHPNQYTYRAKSSGNPSRRAPQSSGGQNQQNSTTHEHGTRRNAKDAANGGGAGPGSRNNHNAYYNNVQLPMFATWGLPDYLAHLQSILPSEVPSPLQIRGSTSFIRQDLGDANTSSADVSNSVPAARDSVGPSTTEPPENPNPQMAEVFANATESVIERGVKVKWPAKRMSVADMNKRVRALVEWVGREQALALDRDRRKAALESALSKHLDSLHSNSSLPTATDKEGPSAITLDHKTPIGSPTQEHDTLPNQDQKEPITKDSVSSLLSTKSTRPSATKMMEELMEDLICFQERFGPSAKGQGRDRRVAVIS